PAEDAEADEVHACLVHQPHVLGPDLLGPLLRVVVAAVGDLVDAWQPLVGPRSRDETGRGGHGGPLSGLSGGRATRAGDPADGPTVRAAGACGNTLPRCSATPGTGRRARTACAPPPAPLQERRHPRRSTARGSGRPVRARAGQRARAGRAGPAGPAGSLPARTGCVVRDPTGRRRGVRSRCAGSVRGSPRTTRGGAGPGSTSRVADGRTVSAGATPRG